MSSGTPIDRLKDGPIDQKGDISKYTKKDFTHCQRQYDNRIDPSKKLITASGHQLNFGFKKGKDPTRYNTIERWLKTGKLSIAEKACKRCIKINSCLPKGHAPHVCVIQARPATVYKNDLRCALCILCKKEKECDIDNSEVEEDDDSTFDASESSDPEEDENMPTPKRCKRLSLVEGNCNRRDDSEEYLPEGSKRSRPSSSLNNAPTNGHVVEQKEQFARMDTFIRDSSNFFKEVTKLREEHAKLKPAHSIALMKVDRLRKERTSLRADCETSEQRVISEANKKRAETLRADRLQREVLQLEQALKQQRRTESTAATSYSSSPATSRTPTFDESKQGTPQSTQVDKGVDDEAARVFQQVVNLRKEIEGCETEAMVIRSELGPRLDEYKSMEAKVEELGRGLGPKLDRLKANEAKTEKLRSDLKAGADRYSQLLRA